MCRGFLLPCRYQFSLAYFARMFSECITDSAKSDDVATRLQLLSDHTTSFVFKSVSRCDGRAGTVLPVLQPPAG